MNEHNKHKNHKKQNENIFITGIGTGVGKTIVSAIFCQALGYDYWKPIQSGELDQSDSIQISKLVDRKKTIHPETYRLQTPISPHAAAAIDGITIDIQNISAPQSENPIIIEGAGGLLVPVNEQHTIADIIAQLDAKVVLVCNHYLGSINHTLLSLAEIHKRNLPLLAIVFNGEANPDSESIIEKMGDCNLILRIPHVKNMDAKWIENGAQKIRSELIGKI
ncbi:MAG: dethiobiotin synthase [Leptospirales bacterium]